MKDVRKTNHATGATSIFEICFYIFILFKICKYITS